MTPPLNGPWALWIEGWYYPSCSYESMTNTLWLFKEWKMAHSVFSVMISGFCDEFPSNHQRAISKLMCYSHPNRRTILGCSPTMGGFETEFRLDVAAIAIPILVRFPWNGGDDQMTLSHPYTKFWPWHISPFAGFMLMQWEDGNVAQETFSTRVCEFYIFVEYRCKPKI